MLEIILSVVENVLTIHNVVVGSQNNYFYFFERNIVCIIQFPIFHPLWWRAYEKIRERGQ